VIIDKINNKHASMEELAVQPTTVRVELGAKQKGEQPELLIRS
jgi:hypothetical protein